MSKKGRRRSRKASGAAPRRSAPPRLVAGLDETDMAMRRKRWDQARQILDDLDRRYPNRVEVLSRLIDVCYELNDVARYQVACERLSRLMPHDPDVTLMLAGAYLSTLRPMSALRTFQRFLERWPDHDQAGDVRHTVATMEGKVDDLLADLKLTGEDGIELTIQHEEMRSLLDQDRYTQARRVAERLLRHRPDFAPALNNLSLAYMAEGQLDQAIATAQRVLAFDPDNFHALSNLAHFLCMSGRLDEARQYAQRLKPIESDVVDLWLKKAEALSYVGDDQGVLDAFEGAERAGHLKRPLASPMLYHLAAVAAMRLGQEDQARQYWNQALKLSPGLKEARDNLADLRKPIGERHAPWPFSLPNLVLQKTIDDLHRYLRPTSRKGSEKAGTQAIQSYLSQHPEIVALVPLLLDRGDPMGRELALRIALASRQPEMQAAARDFVLSQRGPDAMRTEAAHALSDAGLLPPGPVRIWIQGEWREILLMGFELHDEPRQEHEPQVEQWLTQANLALQRRDADEVERLLEQALEVEPDATDLLNNLAVAYELQGRIPEAEAIVRELHRQHPDHLFARTSLAKLSLLSDQIDEAKALLDPLLSRRRFHFSEFAALCSAYIQLLLAQDNRESARSWLDLWASVDPEHPEVARWRRRLGKPGRRGRSSHRRA